MTRLDLDVTDESIADWIDRADAILAMFDNGRHEVTLTPALRAEVERLRAQRRAMLDLLRGD